MVEWELTMLEVPHRQSARDENTRQPQTGQRYGNWRV